MKQAGTYENKTLQRKISCVGNGSLIKYDIDTEGKTWLSSEAARTTRVQLIYYIANLIL